MRVRRLIAALLACALCGLAAVFAHVRLIHPTNGTPLYWSDPQNIGIVISSTGSADIDDTSEETALRNAIDAWNDAGGSTARLVEDSSPTSQARTDWDSSTIHLMLFDENNVSGYFPGGSSTVAITPVWFYSSGLIDDADVLFNGKNFNFTTRAEGGRFDVQDVATHELGHLIGFDHSGWAGSTMYPYVDSTVILHRSLSSDDVHAMRAAYPDGSYSSIRGNVRRAGDDSIVVGAHVVVRGSDGRPVAAALTNASGVFTVDGLAADTYTLYATPLDYPVSSANLGSGWTIETDFESTVGSTVVVGAAETKSTGKLSVGANVSLSLGRNSDRYPLRCTAGTGTSLTVHGAGLSAGSTLTASDPNLGISSVTWFGTQVGFTLTVPSQATPGHSDLTVTNAGGDVSILTAALEITPPDPGVLLVSPNQGDVGGGSAVTLTGTDFNSGARVVVGGEIYEDGAPGGCTVVSSTTITFTTRASVAGTSDVVVIDPSGVEGRKVSAFQFYAVPVLNTVFPAVGDAAGGTRLFLMGENFNADTVVRIDGVQQSSTFINNPQKLRVTTTGGTAGGPYTLQVENSGGGQAVGQFAYVSQADPIVSDVTPAAGTAAGGDVITILGTGFTADSTVTFGADLETGLGGAVASSVSFLSSSELEATTPASSAGVTTVMVGDQNSGQADVLSGAFEFEAEPGGGGGGGGCYTVPVDGPPGPREPLTVLAWLILMALGARYSHRHVPRPMRVGAGR